jgi:dTDP-glucose 4,6-dehydratase
VNKYPNKLFVNLDALTYAGSELNTLEVSDKDNYIFIEGDIRDENLISRLFDRFNFNGVYHLAAESHVDNSISGPKEFITTNIHGTFNLLDTARRFWMESPFIFKDEHKDSKFLHVSTDEVYGTLGDEGLFTEETPYAPNSPYSASKASSDLIVRSYFHTYGMNVVTTNCSNNYGPNQHNEKLIPKIISRALNLETIPIYGDGKNVRDWLYVIDHCEAIDLVFNTGVFGETYNIGGDNEKTTIELTNIICDILDKLKPLTNRKYNDLISYVSDRPGHDKRYAIDSTKLKTELGWTRNETFDSALLKTIKFYLSK